MKRSCHGSNFQGGGGTKGHVNFVEKAIFYGMEFHMYASNLQQINNNIYI